MFTQEEKDLILRVSQSDGTRTNLPTYQCARSYNIVTFRSYNTFMAVGVQRRVETQQL